MPRVLLVGSVPPQTSEVWGFLSEKRDAGFLEFFWEDIPQDLHDTVSAVSPDLLIVAGWRHLIPPDVLAVPRLGTVGFHSAKLPEYPGRAPVPWALLRGDPFTENTMLFLDEGIDTGDIIDRVAIPLAPFVSPEWVYERMAETCVYMLRKHLPALLTGTAPRTPQDLSKRGPLTTKDGWVRWYERERLATGHA